MIRYLYLKARYGSYLQNEYGIKKFAEMSMGQLIHKATKKSAFYREMNENLLVEKANLRLRLDELHENPTLEAGEFFSVRRRLVADLTLMVIVLVAAVSVNFYSATAFIPEGGVGQDVLRWIMAVVLALGGFLLAERFVEACFPVHGARSERRQTVAVLWAVLLAGVELATLGLASVQATMLVDAADRWILFYGYLATSMLLPLVAGAFRWDAMQWIDIFKTTQSVRLIESRLAQIDSILRQNEEYESNFYKVKSLAVWERLNEFRTYKENYNAQKGHAEHLGNHFSQAYELFQAEANKRYEADLRNLSGIATQRRAEIVQQTRSARRRNVVPKQPVLVVADGDGVPRSESEVCVTPSPIR